MRHYFIPVFLFAGTLFFAYLYVAGPPASVKGPSTEIKAQGSARYNQLQQYKQEAAVKSEIRMQRALLNKDKARPELDPSYLRRKKTHKTELHSGLGPAAHDIDNESSYEAMNLDQRMDAFLAKRQKYEELEDAQREAYVQAFIEEADRMGFVVTINENYQIESVTKK